MKVLFVSRKHPPSVGGMQRLSHQLISEMRQRVTVTAVTWGRTQKLLPVFWVYALWCSLVVVARGVDLVHIGDPVLSPIGWIVKKLFRVPVVVTVHGLDVTFPLLVYQWIIPRLLRQLDCLICISAATRRACVDRGVPESICRVISLGVAVPAQFLDRSAAREWVAAMLGRDLEGVSILLTVGRLVPRKGVAWFVECVLPQILAADKQIAYLVVGGGPDEARIRELAARLSVRSNVWVLGQIPDADLEAVYAAADLFIMPNLPVADDMEGFGLVALEAAAHSVPVLAADLEGVREAVVPDQTGWLLPSGAPEIWSEEILRLVHDRRRLEGVAQRAPHIAQGHFSWGRMADAYLHVFQELVKP